MKTLSILTLIACLLVACESKRTEIFDGYIVEKEYIKHHMSNQDVEMQKSAVFIPRVPITTHHAPDFIPSKFTWYIANRYEIVEFEVDSLKFNTKKCGDKIRLIYK